MIPINQPVWCNGPSFFWGLALHHTHIHNSPGTFGSLEFLHGGIYDLRYGALIAAALRNGTFGSSGAALAFKRFRWEMNLNIFSLEKGIPNLETITHDGSMGLVYLHIQYNISHYFPTFPEKWGHFKRKGSLFFSGKIPSCQIFFRVFQVVHPGKWTAGSPENHEHLQRKIIWRKKGCSRQMALTIQVCSFFLGASQHWVPFCKASLKWHWTLMMLLIALHVLEPTSFLSQAFLSCKNKKKTSVRESRAT